MALAIIVLKITGQSVHSKAKTRFHFDLNLGQEGSLIKQTDWKNVGQWAQGFHV